MSFSTRNQHHRRRSHSAASPLPSSRHFDTEKWRTAIKRARPHNLRSPSYKDFACDQPPEKWDVDMWRRGKRVRKGNTSPRMTEEDPSPFAPGAIFGQKVASSALGVISPNLPSTSAAFHFFPERPKKARRTSRYSPRFSEPMFSVSASPDIELPSVDDTNRLRTDALWELHRSVTENGEGLVGRMREWEDSRSHIKRQSPSMEADSSSLDPEDLDDEDDIQIFSGEPSMTDTTLFSSPQGPPLKKRRAISLSVMDVDAPILDTALYAFPDDSEGCLSPVDVTSSAGISGYGSEEEDITSPYELVPRTPALTHTYSNTANSSMVSLPLPPPIRTTYLSPISCAPPTRGYSSPGSFSVPSTASRSEKAIAALTLAMANGAGGLNDYEDLRSSEASSTTSLDPSLIGEMWH